MLDELTRLDDLGREMTTRASARGALLIWRVQAHQTRRVTLRDGRVEGASVAASLGHGAQILLADGRTALASRDDLRPEPALDLLEQVIDAASRAPAAELRGMPTLAVVRDTRLPSDPEALARVDLAAVARRLGEFEREVLGHAPSMRLQLGYRAELELWRIFRSDGTDVLFGMPRASLSLRAASADDPRGGHAVSAVVSGPRADLPWDERASALFLRRAVAATRLAADLPGATPHPAGSFPLVIDYALAKGLAHEAFGHAAEADGFRSSILARNGRYRSGERVGAQHVSIIDEPIEGDHAWQPFSANGLVRERATIVDHGRLADGLSDPWSAEAGGIRLTGAERAESFHHAPLPRMTNIRIEVDQPLEAPGEFEEYGPPEVQALLASAGVLKRHPRVTFLSGYAGGQVNPATGDFVFNCKAIYALGRGPLVLHKPAIFSGSMFGALESVREAFGPLHLDAVGYCGKAGQSVPSSGGSHSFLVLEPHDSVRLGGD